MTAVDISAVLSWQKTFPFMSQTSQNQQTEPSSWPVWADFLISHYMSFQVVLSVIHQTHPSSLQTGKICPWMTRPPTKCCGFQKAAPRFVEELRRFVPSWTGRRDTSTLHRCVTHTHAFRWCLLKKTHHFVFVPFPQRCCAKRQFGTWGLTGRWSSQVGW